MLVIYPILQMQQSLTFWDTISGKVLVSLLTSFFTVILMTAGKSLWEHKIYPFFLELFRKNDQDVNGEWGATYEIDTGLDAVDKMTLKQSGHILKGSCVYTITQRETGKVETKQFVLKGELKNDFLIIYYRNDSRSSKGLGTMTLQIVNDGRCLKGHGVFYDTVHDKLVPVDYEYFRDRA